MKIKNFLLSLLLVTAASAYSQKNSLVGTWKMVSSKITMNDSTTTSDGTKGETMKIITPTHFALLSKGADSALQYAGGGRVTMDNRNYTETVSFFSDKSMLNKVAVFTYKIDGNKCHFEGRIDDFKLDEVWEKVQ
jgi:hypothetical protein